MQSAAPAGTGSDLTTPPGNAQARGSAGSPADGPAGDRVISKYCLNSLPLLADRTGTSPLGADLRGMCE